jgi:hypothetical protein
MALYYDKPSDRLATELIEVKQDADRLIFYLENINFPLSPQFPKKTLLDISKLLLDIPEATAHGCREPLLFAQEKARGHTRRIY